VDVTVVVSTYGTGDWEAMGAATAAAHDALHIHADTLAEARNLAVDVADSEWVIHLDADDSLAPGYIDAMSHATGDLRAPRLRFVHESGRVNEPFDLTRRDIRRTNPCAIGTAVRRADILTVGGWRDWPAFEDFDLFRRLWLAGGRIEHVSAAIYLARRRPGSRNDVADPAGLTRRIIDSHRAAS
jgi:GT2 family glycosyltransferase